MAARERPRIPEAVYVRKPAARRRCRKILKDLADQ